ncbi:phage major capsid protein [Sphingomonas immobilis]|uniref:Phage major capsid protein n=1 Tax=Sphingomonas immobilis TaxID=3063997 RepID=A0ABT8ZWD5_9SPHN|nr:phage major capsid protein [Sphingomonas sp. CA1-15]MDO7841086.1 phage major capsid protein [Sphingomonas sp. CA1-15]
MNMLTSAAAIAAASTPLEFGRKDGGAEPDIKALQTQLEGALNTVKAAAEEFRAKAASGEQISNSAKEKADEALTKLTEIRGEITELSQKLAQGRRGEGDPALKSMGEQVGASEAVKSFAENGARGTIRIPIEQKAITSASVSAGALSRPERLAEIVSLPMRRMRVRDLLMPGRTNSASIEYPKQTSRVNNAAPVAEQAEKPASSYTWTVATANVRTIAHWVPVSRQAMDDTPQLESLIDGELRYGLDIVEEAQLLLGDGTGQNLYGLIPQAVAFAAPAGITAPGATGNGSVDMLRLAMLQAELAEYPATGHVLNPIDWAIIELSKDTQGGYLFANPQQLAGPTMWGLPVVPTQAIAQDKFLTGAFNMAAQIFDRMDTEVLISSEDRDNFITNMLTVRAERRLALAVKRGAALVYGDFGRV